MINFIWSRRGKSDETIIIGHKAPLALVTLVVNTMAGGLEAYKEWRLRKM
jgi:hypothetical protein